MQIPPKQQRIAIIPPGILWTDLKAIRNLKVATILWTEKVLDISVVVMGTQKGMNDSYSERMGEVNVVFPFLPATYFCALNPGHPKGRAAGVAIQARRRLKEVAKASIGPWSQENENEGLLLLVSLSTTQPQMQTWM